MEIKLMVKGVYEEPKGNVIKFINEIKGCKSRYDSVTNSYVITEVTNINLVERAVLKFPEVRMIGVIEDMPMYSKRGSNAVIYEYEQVACYEPVLKPWFVNDSLFEIQDGVLVSCHDQHRTITIPEEVRVINGDAFGKNLTTTLIILPDSLEEIKEEPFKLFQSGLEIRINKNYKNMISRIKRMRKVSTLVAETRVRRNDRFSYEFLENNEVNILRDESREKEVEIPSCIEGRKVTHVSEGFAERHYDHLVMPDSIKDLPNFEHISKLTVKGCDVDILSVASKFNNNRVKLDFDKSLTKEVDNFLLDDTGTVLLRVKKSSKLEVVEIPEYIKEVLPFAFLSKPKTIIMNSNTRLHCSSFASLRYLEEIRYEDGSVYFPPEKSDYEGSILKQKVFGNWRYNKTALMNSMFVNEIFDPLKLDEEYVTAKGFMKLMIGYCRLKSGYKLSTPIKRKYMNYVKSHKENFLFLMIGFNKVHEAVCFISEHGIQYDQDFVERFTGLVDSNTRLQVLPYLFDKIDQSIEESEFKYKKTKDGMEITLYKGTDAYVLFPETIKDVPVTSLGSGIFGSIKRAREFLPELSNPQVYIGENIKEIKTNALYNCSFDVLDLSGKLCFENAFHHCDIDTLQIANSKLHYGAFYRCNIGNLVIDYDEEGFAFLGRVFNNCVIDNCYVKGDVKDLSKLFESTTSVVNMIIDTPMIDYNTFGNKDVYTYRISDLILKNTKRLNSRCLSFENIGNISFEGSRFSFVDNCIYLENTFIKAFKQQHVHVREGTTDIEPFAFTDCDCTEVDFPSSLKRIHDRAFYNNKSLIELEIPDGVEMIGDFAFYLTRINKMNLPKYLKQISSSSFSHRKVLLGVPDDIQYLKVIKKPRVSFITSIDGKELLAMFNVTTSMIEFPKEVEKIHDYCLPVDTCLDFLELDNYQHTSKVFFSDFD